MIRIIATASIVLAPSDPLLAPVDGTTLVFTPDRGTDATGTGVSRTPDSGVEGGLIPLGILGAFILLAVIGSRAWTRAAAR